MPSQRVIPPPPPIHSSRITENVASGIHSQPHKLIADFSKFRISPICLRDEFNNHFKDQQHFCTVAAEFLGKILPKISSHTYSEICEGSQEGRTLHFHAIDKSHLLIVQRILSKYGFPKTTIDQMTEGKDIFEFSAALGHTYAARVVCHKDENVLYFLFFDTNHHIYINERYVRESLFYEECPACNSEKCNYMPADCFAVGYLDEQKISDSFGYSASPI